MSSQCYPSIREKFLRGQFDWLAGTLRCLLLSDGYNPNFANEFLSDIAESSRIAISQELTGRTATDGYAMSDPIFFPLLVDNRLAAKAVIFRDTGVESTSSLVFFMDAPELIPVPFALQGFDYYIYPNVVDGGFFRL